MSDELFSGAALAADQDRYLERGDLDDLGPQSLHGGAGAYDRIETIGARSKRFRLALVKFELALEGAHTPAQRVDLLRSFEHHAADCA
ncbi:MAG: hypothetical protein Q7T73_11770, partial [Beijerinckiaceae bacterium]|nr:hypothetical protein [Beijerinckiaceae bacterium]